MPTDDDISERILEGDAYEQAEVTVRRTFTLPLERKVQTAVGTLAASVVVGPALYLRRALIRSIEGTGPLQDPLGLTIVLLALLGVLTTFTAGLALVSQRYAIARRSLTPSQARRAVRVEDVAMWFVLQGAAFVLLPAAFSVVGVLSPGVIESLYEYGVAVYRPSVTFGIDARLVSGLGAVLAVVLAGAWRRVEAVT